MRLIRAAILSIFVVGFGFGALACSCAHAADIEPFVEFSHTSDITRGKPFNDTPEPTEDYIGAGITITAGARKRFEIDISHGRKSLDRGPWQSGSRLGVRYYWSRK